MQYGCMSSIIQGFNWVHFLIINFVLAQMAPFCDRNHFFFFLEPPCEVVVPALLAASARLAALLILLPWCTGSFFPFFAPACRHKLVAIWNQQFRLKAAIHCLTHWRVFAARYNKRASCRCWGLRKSTQLQQTGWWEEPLLVRYLTSHVKLVN